MDSRQTNRSDAVKSPALLRIKWARCDRSALAEILSAPAQQNPRAWSISWQKNPADRPE
jgi:hypothetical protein